MFRFLSGYYPTINPSAVSPLQSISITTFPYMPSERRTNRFKAFQAYVGISTHTKPYKPLQNHSDSFHGMFPKHKHLFTDWIDTIHK